MKTLSIDVRRAEPHDARAISEAHRLSWQQAYAGLIPHKPLTQMLERRGEVWWKKATKGSATMLVVEVAGVVGLKPGAWAAAGRRDLRTLSPA
jgi:hypothetical protein